MAQDDIKKFFDKLEADEALQKKMKNAAADAENEALDKVVKIAAAAGFKFTSNDLVKARKRRMSVDISSEDLAGVSGGMTKPIGVKPIVRGAADCCYNAQGCMPYFVGS